jgi:hypothetical protein
MKYTSLRSPRSQTSQPTFWSPPLRKRAVPRVLRWLAGYLGLADPYAAEKRAAQLTEDRALSIAREASSGVSDADSLGLVAIENDGGERLWVFATTSRGSTWHVKVRDRDGLVVSRGRRGTALSAESCSPRSACASRAPPAPATPRVCASKRHAFRRRV